MTSGNNNSSEQEKILNTIVEYDGALDLSDYKLILLNLIFLKYSSDIFQEKYDELLLEGKGFEEDKNEYVAEKITFIPKNARWKDISKVAHDEGNGIAIDMAMRLIEDENSYLKGILFKNFAKPEIDKQKLGELIDLITNINIDGSKNIFWSELYEKCLYKFFEEEGTEAGGSYTPSCIIKTIINILKPTKGRIYDPCCGTGGMFIQTKKFLEAQGKTIDTSSIYGQEVNDSRWKLLKLNLAIHQIEADVGEYPENTFTNDVHSNLYANYILANPKFNMKDWGLESLEEDGRWSYGLPPSSNANFAWVQHMIYHLAGNGKIGLVLANGSLSSTTGGEGKIRKNIVEDDLVECIISLPTQLFYTGGMPVCLWFLNKRKKQRGKTLFIDAREMGTMVSRKLRELTDEDIKLITETYDKFLEGNLEDEKGFCKVSDLEEIIKHDFILTPGRYVGFKLEEPDEKFEESMKILTKELYDLMDESYELDKKIKQNLHNLGF